MIRIKGLQKIYRTGFFRKSIVALDGIDLSVTHNEIYGFIGPNGSGKSTTIKILLGLLRPSAGEVLVDGMSPRLAASRRNVGYLPEFPYFYDFLTGWELLRFFGVLSGVASPILDDRIREVCQLLGIEFSWLSRKLRTLSKGMMQRLAFAQAIIGKPRLLVLDEPMSGLDPMGRREFRNIIMNLKNEGSTIFYSSHVLSDVEEISDRVALMISGRLRRIGTLQEVVGTEKNLEEVLAQEVCKPPL